MLGVNFKKNSMVRKLALFMLVAVVLQSLFLIGAIVAGGVLDELRKNALNSFCEKVSSRGAYLQGEITHRWANFGSFTVAAQNAYNAAAEPQLSEDGAQRYLDRFAPRLVDMLRTTTATGCFIVMADDTGNTGRHSALYMRDYDPLLNGKNAEGLYMLAGSSEIARSLGIPLDKGWNYQIILNDANREFYRQPYDMAQAMQDNEAFGYWSKPFVLLQGDAEIITYTEPLYDSAGEIFGVIGIELMTDYLQSFLPNNEFETNEPLGYALGVYDSDTGVTRAIVMPGESQRRILNEGEPLDLKPVGGYAHFYSLDNAGQGATYIATKELKIYEDTTPFENEHLVLMGMARSSALLEFADQTRSILLLAFVFSIVFGSATVFWGSYVFVKPIAAIANKVRSFRSPTERISLGRVGILEIDDLAGEIETLNQNMLDSTLRVSEIMRMVDVPVGVFEYKLGADVVFGTELLFSLLSFDKAHCVSYVDKNFFFEKLHTVLQRPELEEDDVYRVPGDTLKWLRIRLSRSETSILGAVIDVTEDITEKNKIRRERDTDQLTGLYSAAAFERIAQGLINKGKMHTAAFVMFDLDNLKQINDTYGHETGDLYIQATAQLLAGFCQHSALVGRRSGDEFYVLLYLFENKKKIRELLESFFAALEKNPIYLPDGSNFTIQISAGVAWFGENSESLGELEQCADIAMYEVKRSGKGTFQEFNCAERKNEESK